ncbi:MAG: IS110 family transposase [Desulfobacteraceae bacterium]|nr:IS110 family transposase [Desulfobacteraceae bacterium]
MRLKEIEPLHTLQPDAAGIDIGATEIYVAVPKDRDNEHVRCFSTFTEDLHNASQWLKKCRIKSVAMESTGIYWIPIFQILETHGFDVVLVNAHHVKNVPGRKTDVQDCQWIQYLHSVGLLRGSFRPGQDICAVRSLLRHRDNLIKTASIHVQHMQKSLTQMNIQFHNVISDITGVTGLSIIDAIVAGQRDLDQLAGLRDPRIKASKEKIRKSLEGDYRSEHIFTLNQALQTYRHYQKMIKACDIEIEKNLNEFDSRIVPEQPALPSGKKKPRGNAPDFDLRHHMHRLLGTDLTLVDGIDVNTAHTIFTEIGPDLSCFPAPEYFCSWLGLCPTNKISGGKILSSKTKPGSNRVAQKLRMAAQSLLRSQSYLGKFYRRLRARLGAPKAITATAHKLARIIYHLIKNQKSFDQSIFMKEQESHKMRLEKNLKKQAKYLGFQLVAAQH